MRQANGPQAVKAVGMVLGSVLKPLRGLVARRFVRWSIVFVAGLCVLILAGAALILRFFEGPLPVEWVQPRVNAALMRMAGVNGDTRMSAARIERLEGAHRLVVENLSILGQDGVSVIAAPRAEIDLGVIDLVTGELRARRVDFSGLDLQIVIEKDGAMRVFPQARETSTATPPAPDQAAFFNGATLSGIAGFVDLLAAESGPFSRFNHLAIRDGRLIVDDRKIGTRFAFDGVMISIDRVKRGGHVASLRAETPSGPLQIGLSAGADAAGQRRASLDIAALPLAEIIKSTGLAETVSLTQPAVGRVDWAFDQQGRPERAQVNLSLGGMRLSTGTSTASSGQPLDIDTLRLEATIDHGVKRIEIVDLSLQSGMATLSLSGHAVQEEEGRHRLVIERGEGRLASRFAPDKPIDLRKATGMIQIAGRSLTIERFEASGSGFAMSMQGGMPDAADLNGLKLALAGRLDSITHLMALWPPLAAPYARAYVGERILAARFDELTIDLSFDAAAAAAIAKAMPPPDSAIRIALKARDVEYKPLDGLPNLTQGQVQAQIGGQGATLSVPQAVIKTFDGTSIALLEGQAQLRGFEFATPTLSTSFRTRGSAEALTDFLESPAIRKAVPGIEDTELSKGQFDARLAVGFAGTDAADGPDIQVTANGTIGNVRIEGARDSDAISDANLAVQLDKGVLNAKGTARLWGAPAQIEIRKSLKGPGEANLSLTLDDEARQRQSAFPRTGIKGPLLIRMNRNLAAANQRTRVEIDLARAQIDGLVPGWVKPAGRPGKVHFMLAERGNDRAGVELQDFLAESQGFQIRGAIQLDADGKPRQARFSQLRLSPGDDARAEIDRTATGMRILVRANTLDARPFLNAVMGQGAPIAPPETPPPPGGPPEVALDLRANIFTGHNGQSATNAELKLTHRGRDIRQFELSGRFGRGTVAGQIARRADGSGLMGIQTSDAGAFLRFIDLYRRMVGGSLLLQMNTDALSQDGVLSISNFVLRDEPALRRLVNETTATAGRASGEAAAERAPRPGAAPPRSDVLFTKMRADFKRLGGRIELREGVIWGNEIGGSIEGVIDNARDRIDMTGTFVPAYALNNAFAQVPLFGPLLGGGRYGGLFAVNFKLSGQASTPTLSINPLSALAPGFTRKLFDFQREGEKSE